MTLKLLKESLLQAPIIRRGGYNYFIHPITDGIPQLKPDLLDEVCCALQKHMRLEDAEYILTIESMGIHIASALSLKTGLPLKIIRKKRYWLKDEKILKQKTGYGGGDLYMNYVSQGDKIALVDAVISTGGTYKAVVEELSNVGAEVVDLGCAIGRGDGKEKIKSRFNLDVKTLADIEVIDDVRIINSIE
ncbi:MAG: adenine phosphoribosyltransferase [Candidatus Altiarchaeales archaeon]|nr:adenine phosphoribosyltransferase [Candidatus Altiarchaeales archaeon]